MRWWQWRWAQRWRRTQQWAQRWRWQWRRRESFQRTHLGRCTLPQKTIDRSIGTLRIDKWCLRPQLCISNNGLALKNRGKKSKTDLCGHTAPPPLSPQTGTHCCIGRPLIGKWSSQTRYYTPNNRLARRNNGNTLKTRLGSCNAFLPPANLCSGEPACWSFKYSWVQSMDLSSC